MEAMLAFMQAAVPLVTFWLHFRRLLGMPNLEYKTVAQTEYLIEVRCV